MEDLCQSEINKKIPIRITWIKNKDGFHEPEISLDIDDFFEFEGSITDAIVEFKKKYSKIKLLSVFVATASTAISGQNNA